MLSEYYCHNEVLFILSEYFLIFIKCEHKIDSTMNKSYKKLYSQSSIGSVGAQPVSSVLSDQ